MAKATNKKVNNPSTIVGREVSLDEFRDSIALDMLGSLYNNLTEKLKEIVDNRIKLLSK